MPKTCPHLPEPEPEMSHRCLTKLRGGDLEAFYLTALRYGHYLWLQGHAGRAILAMTRALYTDLDRSRSRSRVAPVRGRTRFMARSAEDMSLDCTRWSLRAAFRGARSL